MIESYATLPSMTALSEYIALDGWELLDPLPRDHGYLFRASKGKSVVQAASESELCKRIWDIERGVVRLEVRDSSNN